MIALVPVTVCPPVSQTGTPPLTFLSLPPPNLQHTSHRHRLQLLHAPSHPAFHIWSAPPTTPVPAASPCPLAQQLWLPIPLSGSALAEVFGLVQAPGQPVSSPCAGHPHLHLHLPSHRAAEHARPMSSHNSEPPRPFASTGHLHAVLLRAAACARTREMRDAVNGR